MQVSLGVSKEGDRMSHPHADSHSSETGRRAVQYGLSFYSHPAGHRAGGVVRAAGVGVQSVLMVERPARTITIRHVQVTRKPNLTVKHISVYNALLFVHKKKPFTSDLLIVSQQASQIPKIKQSCPVVVSKSSAGFSFFFGLFFFWGVGG